MRCLCELIQTRMAQKKMLPSEFYACALNASQSGERASWGMGGSAMHLVGGRGGRGECRSGRHCMGWHDL